jgi:guanylate kinase
VLLQAGVAGVVLGWFMWRAEKKWDQLLDGQDRIEAAQNRQVRAQMLNLLSRDDTPPSVKQLAQDLSEETNTADEHRKRLRAARSRLSRSSQSESS